MSWFTASRAGLRYSGRITYRLFAEWCETPEGAALVTALGAGIRFAPFGRRRTARRRLWRDLSAAARGGSLAAALQAEADRYLALMAEMAYAEALPRAAVDLQRLVVVPRSLLNGVMGAGVEQRMRHPDLVPSLPGGSPVHAFIGRQLVRELDQAVLAWRATPRRPLPATGEWASVGHDTSFAWAVSLGSEPAFRGHHHLFEVPRRGLTWRGRRALRSRMLELEERMAALTRDQRQEILRQAWAPFLPRAA